MKNTASSLAGPLKRRTFFVTAIGALAGVWTGPSLIRRLIRSGTTPAEKDAKISITINPMAVPRTTKGVNRHG